MNPATCKSLYTLSWKDLYRAAIHEPDMNKMIECITEAESALVIRMRELFNTGDNFEEVESMDDALSILHALRSSLKHRPAAIRSPSSLVDSSTTLRRRREA